MKLPEIHLYADGGARGNPGPAGAGAVLIDDSGKLLAEKSLFLGQATNNVAEYSALILGLREASSLHPEKIKIFLDSQLIVRQIQGQYRVKNPALKKLFDQTTELLKSFPAFEIEHIPREKNKHADRLANEAMDQYFENDRARRSL